MPAYNAGRTLRMTYEELPKDSVKTDWEVELGVVIGRPIYRASPDEAEYHGELVNFDPIWCYPKPVQKPHPPIYVGGNGEHTLRRVVQYGDGWMTCCRLKARSCRVSPAARLPALRISS